MFGGNVVSISISIIFHGAIFVINFILSVNEYFKSRLFVYDSTKSHKNGYVVLCYINYGTATVSHS